MIPAIFFINDRVYRGYYDPAVNWNGFVVPYFTLEVARKIMYEQCPTDWFYDETATMFVTIGDDSKEYEPTATLDTGELLWSIGGMEWAWELSEL